MLTEEQLREIEAAEQAATAGPWHHNGCELYYGTRIHQQIWHEPDARFLAGARTWVPQLLAMVREQQETIVALDRMVREQALYQLAPRPANARWIDFRKDLHEAYWSRALTTAEEAALDAGATPDQVAPEALYYYVDVRGGGKPVVVIDKR